jgi:hypothetical protein
MRWCDVARSISNSGGGGSTTGGSRARTAAHTVVGALDHSPLVTSLRFVDVVFNSASDDVADESAASDTSSPASPMPAALGIVLNVLAALRRQLSALAVVGTLADDAKHHHTECVVISLLFCLIVSCSLGDAVCRRLAAMLAVDSNAFGEQGDDVTTFLILETRRDRSDSRGRERAGAGGTRRAIRGSM